MQHHSWRRWRGPTLARPGTMALYVLFAVALIAGYLRPMFTLVLFPILLLYGGYWAFGPLLLAVLVLMDSKA